jgi:DNA-directed RNA polymerase specialized sigma24 family protein
MNPDHDHRRGRADFETTKWTLVVSANGLSEDRARMALEELCRSYWYPLFVHVRGLGYSKEDTEDLVQSFFARMLEKNTLEGADPARGRFRSFLLVSLKHFLTNEWDKSQAWKRGGRNAIFSLDALAPDHPLHDEPTEPLSPEILYDRAWALTLLQRVLEGIEQLHHNDAMFAHIKSSLTLDRHAVDYADVAHKLGVSEGAVRVAVYRLRCEYRELLRKEISHTLSDKSLIEDELTALRQAFRDRG